jgi:signal transduction histidine kinase
MLVSGDAGPGAVTVRMLDDGTPPPPGAQHFEPFAPPRGRGPLVGAGVSLPVCRRLVERRGGTIAMDVRDDGATVVTVELPPAAP